MTLRRTVGISTALAVASASFLACSSSDSGDTGASAAVTGSQFGPTRFRNDFYTYLKEAAKGDEAKAKSQLNDLVYLPTDEMMNPGVSAIDPNSPLQGYDEYFSKFLPSQLYDRGAATTPEEQAGLVDALRKNPVHIVIVPGIFSEWIPRTPYEEIFLADSAAKRKFADLVRSNPDTSTDLSYRLDQLKDVEVSLGDYVDQDGKTQPGLLRVGSIDDDDGTPLVTVTYLRANLGSLEDFGTLAEDNVYYLRRLGKYFDLIGGIPQNLYVMGYSRGTPTALDLVATAARDPDANPWVKHLKGFIGLAGVTYGSQLADAAFVPGSGQKKILDALQKLADDLEECPAGTAWSDNASLRTRNDGRYASFGIKNAGAAVDALLSHHQELDWEGIDPKTPDSGRFVNFAMKVAFDHGIVNLQNWNSEYCENVSRFKVLVKKMLDGASSLTTDSRIDWWRNNVLPTGPRYFSITGTMGDPSADESSVWKEGFNADAYDTASIDFKSLRTNYYDFLDASKAQGAINPVNDSQVALQRGRFWGPELHRVLNSQQGALKTYFMGTLGVHHWGLAFPRAYDTNDGLEANPYPRTLLLKTIATFVSQVDQAER